MYVSYYQVGGAFDFTEYVFGDENCCDDYPVPLCDEEECILKKRITLILQTLKIGM